MKFNVTLFILFSLLTAGVNRADPAADAQRLALAQAQAEAELRLAAQRSYAIVEHTGAGRDYPEYNWTHDAETAAQLTLWDGRGAGRRQLGAFRLADRQYFAYAGGAWSPAALPFAIPEKHAARPFQQGSTDASTSPTSASSAAPSSPPSRAAAPSPALTFINASVGIGGGTMINEQCTSYG